MPAFAFTGGNAGPLETTTVGSTPTGVSAFATGWCWDRFNINSIVGKAFNDSTRGKVIRISDAGTGEATHEYTFPSTIGVSSKLMVKYYGRYSVTGSIAGRQIKAVRICAGTSDIIDSNHNYLYTQRDGEEHIYVNSSGTADQDVWDFGSESDFIDGTWKRFEHKIVTGTQGNRDGQTYFRRNLNGSYLSDTATSTGRDIQSQVYTYPTTDRYGSCMWQQWWGNGYSNGDFAIDDHYISMGTFKCVELWNSLTPASATIREIQEPTSWSSTSVTVRLNKGGVAPGSYYLVVLDDTVTDTVLASRAITVT